MFQLGICEPEQRRMRPSSIPSTQNLVKRAFDIIVSTSGLLLLSPLILLISLVIRIESRGPVLCRRRRYNSGNAEFEIFEFRTSVLSRREKTQGGSRDETQDMTRFGQILRRSGIDRIPHLMNVQRGEVSMVGSHLFTNAPGNAVSPPGLGNIKPGLITMTHAFGDRDDVADNDINIYRRIKYDRFYMENYSLLLDAKIIFHALLSKNTWLQK